MKGSGRWIVAGILSLLAATWLVWAFPRLHPAARLGLRYDRDGYLDAARKMAASHGVDVSNWRAYVKTENLSNNQELHLRMPSDKVAQSFPDADVLTNFLPLTGPGVKITTRPDGHPLSWKMPMPAAKGAPSDMGAASKAMHEMAGEDSGGYTMMEHDVPEAEGLAYKWVRKAAAGPHVDIQTTVKDGIVWQAKTVFTLPEKFNRTSDTFSVLRVIAGCAWSIWLALAIIVPVMREGGGAAARAMKDRSPIVLSAAAALAVTLAGMIEWDDEMISVSVASGASIEVLSLVLGGLIIGLLFYSMSAATVMNARVHPARVRGFRLLGTSAFYSRQVGAELLGGWLFAPVLVALPLLTGAVFRQPVYKGFLETLPLSRLPVPDALLNATAQETVAVIAFLGVLLPFSIRFSRSLWMRRTLCFFFALATFAMLSAPFRDSNIANLLRAALEAAAMLWLYFNFGMLGALSAHCSARILTSAGVLLVQPAAGIHASGWGTLLAFAGLGMAALAAVVKGPDAVAELYGETGARLQTLSRREELLAEFNVARSAQRQMLPADPPVLAGYTISASCDPAREVGGDLYDFLHLSDGRWGIGVADVSGKGVPAALYMTLTKGLLCAAAQDSGDPRQILAAVNKHLRTVTKKKMFVTMALGVLDPEARRMEYVRAGHNPVVWRRRAANETRLLTGNGIGLGIAGPALFAKTLATETLELAPGDALVFYSDGLTEAMTVNQEQFGEERLAAAVERTDGMHALDTRDSILREVKQFLNGVPAQDDLTIAVLRVDPDIGS